MASFSRTSSNTRGKIFLFKTYEEELINRINWNIIADSESSDSYFYETEDELNYEQDNTSSLVYSLSFSLINYVKDFFSLDIGVSAEEDTTPIAPEEGYNETEAPHSFSYPGLEFQFTKCDLTIDPFNVSLLALQDVNWLDDSTLALKVNVALRSESTVLGASYRIINNTIALNYNSSMCLVCAQSYCVRSLYYTITGLENKNYSFFIERTEEDEIGSIEDGILAISAHMSRPITLSNLSANATRINSSLGPTNYYFDRAVMMRVIDGGDILQGSFLSGKELPVTFSSKNNYTKMDAGDNVSLFLNNGFLYFERRSGQNLPLLVESVGAGVILDNIYLISNKASGKVALSGQGLFKDFNGAAPMEFTPYVSKNRPHQTDNGVYYEPYFGYLFIDKNMTPAKIIISDNGDLYILNKDTPVDKNGNIINKKGKRHTGMAILTGNVINSFDSLKSKITGEVVDSEVVSDFDWDSIDNRWIEIVDKR